MERGFLHLMEHSSSQELKAALDGPWHALGFELELAPKSVSGHLRVTEKNCRVLHGGISAWIAESLASIGAHMASGLKISAGIQLSINHLKPAKLGDLVHAVATPINVGESIQEWEETLWKVHPSNLDIKSMVASSTVTIICNMTVPDHAKPAGEILKKFAKL